MEPITTAVVAALAKLSEPAIRDAYDGLKKVIVRRLGADHKITEAVASVESKPESKARQEVLNEEIVEAKAGDDAELHAALQVLMKRLEEHGAAPASNRVTASGERSVAVGGSAVNTTIRTGDEAPPAAPKR